MAATFTITRDQIINSAYRLMGYLGEGQVATTEDINNGAQALNLLIKAWMVEGLDLWFVRTVGVPMVANQVSYTLGPSGSVVVDRPLRVLNAFIRDATGFDTPLEILSRSEYVLLGDKTPSATVPTSIYYDPQLTNGVLYVYPPSFLSTSTMHILVQTPVTDVTSSAQVPEFPSEWFQALKWGLADEMCDEYAVAPSKIQRITAKAQLYKEQMVSWSSSEEVSTYFSLEQR